MILIERDPGIHGWNAVPKPAFASSAFIPGLARGSQLVSLHLGN